MGMTMRVSLAGFNALTETAIDNYSIYADSDNILIKELQRGTIGVNNGASGTFTHGLGYVPFYLTYATTGAGTYEIISAFDPVGAGWRSQVGTNNLIITNGSGTNGTVQYYVFYDDLI